MKYTSKTGQDIILDGKIYVCGKDKVIDLPKKYDHPDLTESSGKTPTEKSLDKMTLAELKELAKDIDGSDKMKKAELIEALTE